MADAPSFNQSNSNSLPTEVTEQINQLYKSKIEALELNTRTINQILEWVKIGGSALAIGLALLGWWFGNSYSAATENAQKSASSAFEREFFKNAENARDFAELKKKYDSAISNLAKIESDLKGYSDLRNIVGNIENFDPLELYASLDKEIDEKYDKSMSYGEPQSEIKLTETVYDPAFRQRASFVFDRLLKAVKDDAKSGKPKVEVVTLFNAAANASKMNMDFVSLELMEAAVAQDKSKSPENAARLIRQRLTMSRISSEDAIQAIQISITQVGGFYLNQVLAEAFNIGIRTAEPGRLGKIIMDKLSAPLKETSIAKLTASRLYLMGSTQAEWQEGEKLLAEGISLLQEEPKSVQWRKDSFRELKKIKEMGAGIL